MSLNDNVLIKIRDMRESFTPVERLVGDYILENTEEILICRLRNWLNRVRQAMHLSFVSVRRWVTADTAILL